MTSEYLEADMGESGSEEELNVSRRKSTTPRTTYGKKRAATWQADSDEERDRSVLAAKKVASKKILSSPLDESGDSSDERVCTIFNIQSITHCI